MQSPRGKYNGQLIDGFEIKFQLTLGDWRFFINWWSYDSIIFHFLCFKLWIQWHYIRS